MTAPLHVVVTGARGFVGNFLAHRFANRGFLVTAITRQPLPLQGHPSLTWRRADLAMPASLPPKFDVLIHCAAEIPARCANLDLLYTRNMAASCSVFDQAVTAGARCVVFMSSMSAFGTISRSFVTEATLPDQPDPYGQAKLDSEKYLETHIHDGLYSGLSIRLPGTVGKGSHHNFLSDALARILAGETVTAKNPHALFNNIVYVGDLAGFLERWIATPPPGYAMTMLAAEQPLPMARVGSLLFEATGKLDTFRFEDGGKKPFLILLDHALSLGYQPASVEASIRAMVRDCLRA
jgi:nucleoside-diphosphate-sugar epimerase